MKKFSTFILSAFVCTMAMAQAPITGSFVKTATPPVIDGVVDDVWAAAPVHNIDGRIYETEPTLGASGETTWQGLWDDDGIYILVKVADDVFFPHYLGANPEQNYNYDKVELYFDCNAVKQDGIGAKDGSGHMQLNFRFDPAKLNGEQTTERGMVGAFVVANPTYIAEYFLPFWGMVDSEGEEVDRSIPMGFDVNITDRDTEELAPQRAVWANVGAVDENWNNMDGAGLVTFDFADGVKSLSANSMKVYPNPVGCWSGERIECFIVFG